MHHWLQVETTTTAATTTISTTLEPLSSSASQAAPRRYRNGSLGSKHYLGKYGYRHRRTLGQHYGGESDMNVEKSLNFLFEQKTPSQNHTTAPRPTTIVTDCCSCHICGMDVSTPDELTAHLEAPARPISTPTTMAKSLPPSDDGTGETSNIIPKGKATTNKRKMIVESADGSPMSHGEKSVSHSGRELTRQSDDGTRREGIATVEANDNKASRVIVAKEHEGKRLKWYCRNVLDSSLTKKECDNAIKDGRVLVNQSPALDSSRILHEFDTVTLLHSSSQSHSHSQQSLDVPSSADLPSTSPVDTQQMHQGVRMIAHESDKSIMVVYKPVGIRACGTFSSKTLEGIMSTCAPISQEEEQQQQWRCLTKLDTGCAGLCVMSSTMPADNGTSSNINLEVTSVFTALVHGTVPHEWHVNGAWLTLDTQGSRQWKRKNRPDDDLSEDKLLSTATDNGLQVKSTEIISEQKAPGERIFVKAISSATCCLDVQKRRNVDQDDTVMPVVVSTIEISVSSQCSRLCNALCHMLRTKYQLPVVNDRFCKQEFMTLPRSMRSVLKQKLCIGCFGVTLTQHDKKTTTTTPWTKTIKVDVPYRMNASFWNDFVSNPQMRTT
eukprot:scaffold182037_cov44-Attheya_sp.AAC.1